MKNIRITIVANRFIQNSENLSDTERMKIDELYSKLKNGVYSNDIYIDNIRFLLQYTKIESGNEWKDTSEI